MMQLVVGVGSDEHSHDDPFRYGWAMDAGGSDEDNLRVRVDRVVGDMVGSGGKEVDQLFVPRLAAEVFVPDILEREREIPKLGQSSGVGGNVPRVASNVTSCHNSKVREATLVIVSGKSPVISTPHTF